MLTPPRFRASVRLRCNVFNNFWRLLARRFSGYGSLQYKSARYFGKEYDDLLRDLGDDFYQKWEKLAPEEKARRLQNFQSANLGAADPYDDIKRFAYEDWKHANSLAEKYEILLDFCIARQDYPGANFWSALLEQVEVAASAINPITAPVSPDDSAIPGQGLVRLGQFLLAEYYPIYVEPVVGDMHHSYYGAPSDSTGDRARREAIIQAWQSAVPGLFYGLFRRIKDAWFRKRS